jgi:hypothetical protein
MFSTTLSSWLAQSRSKIHPKQIASRLALGAALIYATIALCGPQGIQALVQKHREIRALQEHNAAMAQEIRERQTELDELSTNPDEHRLKIRKDLRLQGQHETTFVINGSGGKNAGDTINSTGDAASKDPAGKIEEKQDPVVK